jgi:uncharacterized protein
MTARLAVRVHPGASVAGLTGRLADGTLKLAVREAAEGGRANRAVEALLAALLGLPRARVTVVRGAASRAKVIEIAGLDRADAERRLARALAAGGAARGR